MDQKCQKGLSLNLAWNVCLLIICNQIEWAATGKNCTTLQTREIKRLRIPSFYYLSINYINILVDDSSIFKFFTWLHVYASSAVHSDCEVGFERARIIGFCMSFVTTSASEIQQLKVKKMDHNRRKYTSFKDAMASMTSFVKVLPTPDDPINTVGLIAWGVTSDEGVHYKRGFLVKDLQCMLHKRINPLQFLVGMRKPYELDRWGYGQASL